MPKAGTVKASGRPQPVLSFLRTCFISNKDLAKAVGYSETYTSMANRGLQPTSADYREKVAAYLELSPEVRTAIECGNARRLFPRFR